MRIGLSHIVDGRPGRGLEFAQESARAAERTGFSSYWSGDHVVYFSDYESKYPYSDNGKFGLDGGGFRADQGLFEPLMMLQAAALATTTIRLGIGVEIVPERNPLIRARDITTLDHFSNGRFDYGVGVGWSAEEYAALGVPWDARGARCDEYLEVMKTVWADTPTASFHGRFVEFDDLVAFPKPIQRPHPPIFVGGNSRVTMRRLARLGDGWLGWNLEVAEVDECLVMLDEEMAAVGRDRSDVKLYLGRPFHGDWAELAPYVDELATRGIEEFVIGMALSSRRFDEQLESCARALIDR